MPLESETLPCPFCGGTNIVFTNHGKISTVPGHQNDDVWSTCCRTCTATFPSRYRKQLLVDCWNRRPRSQNPNIPVTTMSEPISTWHTKYRVTLDRFGLYVAERWCIYWPFWTPIPVFLDTNGCATLESAENLCRRTANPVVKIL